MRAIRNFVAGEFAAPIDGSSWTKIDPVDGQPSATVDEADRGLVDRAVNAARRALDGSWGRTSVAQRTALLRRVADRIEDRFEEFVVAESTDTGKPQQQARELDVARALANFRVFADTVAAAGLPSFLTELPDGRRALNYAVRKPLGVVAVIVPWNLPLLLLTWKVAPALACGNTVVVKPSEETPSTATLLAEVCAEAGVPPGVYNVVHGFGPDSAGEFLVPHPGIDGVTFTGSSATGSRIMAAVAPRVKPVSFELGGKNAAIVFADADLDLTLDGAHSVGFRQHRPGVSVHGAALCPAANLRRDRRRVGPARPRPPPRPSVGSGDDHWPVDLGRASRESAVLLPVGR